jgi:hypothetical protein
MKTWILATLVAATGCATTGGGKTAQQLTGDPYSVKDEGNRLTGLVCGVAVDYTVDHRGDRTVLGSFGRPAHLEVTANGAERHIVGTLGTHVGADEVDLTVTPDRLTGRAGLRNFDLKADGDRLRGVMTTLYVHGNAEATVEGRSELAKLDDAAVGAVLPSLLNCEHFGHQVVQPPMLVRIGGPAGYSPRENNSER